MDAKNLDTDFNFTHLLDILSLNQLQIEYLLTKANKFLQNPPGKILENYTLANLFFEPSTRTRSSFELAAKRLGMTVININPGSSAHKKNESLLDTIYNLQAMGVDVFTIRHKDNGTAQFVADNVRHAHVINAGDGTNEHPSQALLDMFTILKYKHSFCNLRVAIVGDILHSRVARSQIYALNILGVKEINLIAPDSLMSHDYNLPNVYKFSDLHKGIKDADVIITLRLQTERMQQGLVKSTAEYFTDYGLKLEDLAMAKKDVIVMHPGPMNREVEIASNVADSNASVILQQVKFSIPVRQAIISTLLNR